MLLIMEQGDGQIPCSVRPKTPKNGMVKSSSLQNFKAKCSGKLDRGRLYQPTIGEDLEVVELDRIIKTDPSDNKNRRALLLRKQNGSWGFTLQSYGVHHRESGETEILTYVDYVALGGAASHAGMRPGDVILSINGISMETATHSAIVNYIKACSDTMRMVVLFEDCVQKVELHLRYIKLRRVLMEKVFELRSLESQETRILEGRHKEARHLSMAESSSTGDLQWETLSLKNELNWTSGSTTSESVNSDPLTPLSTPGGGNDIMSPESNSFGSRKSYDRLSLPVGGRQRPHSWHESPNNSPLKENGVVPEKRPLSCILESQSQESSFDDPALKKRFMNSSVSGEVSFVRDCSKNNSPFPLLPRNYPLASPENPLCNTSSRLAVNGSSYHLPPPRRSSFRRSSRHYSINHRQIHGNCNTNCAHNRESSDHVVTEDNFRTDSDPHLLWIKHFEANPAVRRRSRSDNSLARTQEIHQKVLRPASISLPCDMDTSTNDQACELSHATDGFTVGSVQCENPQVEAKWEEIENLSTRMSQASISFSTSSEIPLTPSSASRLNDSLDSNVFQDSPTETFGAKFSFAQSPFEASTPRKFSEKRRRSRTLSFSKSEDVDSRVMEERRLQETPMSADVTNDRQGQEMNTVIQGRQLFYVNEKEETTKL